MELVINTTENLGYFAFCNPHITVASRRIAAATDKSRDAISDHRHHGDYISIRETIKGFGCCAADTRV
jgi:hypothetical protein